MGISVSRAKCILGEIYLVYVLCIASQNLYAKLLRLPHFPAWHICLFYNCLKCWLSMFHIVSGQNNSSVQLCLYTQNVCSLLNFILSLLCAFFFFISGIELDEDGTLDGNSDSTIRGRLLYLVEKVTYLKKKQAEKTVDEDDKTSCKQN